MKYSVVISPVRKNQSAVVKLVTEILGPDEIKKARDLVKQGGTVVENLNKEAANNFAGRFLELGTRVEVREIPGDESGDGKANYQVWLVDSGENKLAVVKVIREITGLGLKDAKELVYNTGMTGVYTNEKEAQRVLKKLNSVGAKVRIERVQSPDRQVKVEGLQLGVVKQLQKDPGGGERILVRIPLLHGEGEGAWCKISSLHAGKDRGMFFRPEIDDEVIVGFIENDPARGVILGMCSSSSHPSPLESGQDNQETGYISRSGIEVIFNDDKKSFTIETPAGNKLKMSEEGKEIILEDQNGNKLSMTREGITLESAKDIVLKASGNLKAEGSTIEIIGSKTKVEGGASAEISSSGITTVKGSLVNIN